MSGIKDMWESFPADKKTNIKKASVTLAIVAVLYLAYEAREASKTPEEISAALVKTEVDIMGDATAFEDDVRAEARGIVKKSEDKVAKLAESQLEMAQLLQDMQANKSREQLLASTDGELGSEVDFPNFPPPVNSNYGIANDSDIPSDAINTEVKTVGGLGKASGLKYQDPNAKKKRGKNSFYLPPGFMKARLLEGLEIASTQSARSNPAPTLFMVQKPAVLPNDVKANLKGCFVVGSATGHLNKERIDFRTVSLHCVSHKEQTIVDAPIDGHVNDIDGKQGLTARVVTRVGATIGRAFAADFVGGWGKGYAASSQTSSVQTISGGILAAPPTDSQVAKTAIGNGVEAGTSTLKKFYEDIIDQTSPTLESGTGRDVTIVITKGVWLDLTAMNKEGSKL